MFKKLSHLLQPSMITAEQHRERATPKVGPILAALALLCNLSRCFSPPESANARQIPATNLRQISSGRSDGSL